MRRELKLGQQYEMGSGEIMTIIGFDEKGDPYCRSNVSDGGYIKTEKGIPFTEKFIQSLECLNE